MKYIFSIAVLFFISCSTESNVENTNPNSDTQITGFKTTSVRQADYPGEYQTITNGIVQNGKLIEINQMEIIDGVNQDVQLLQSFTYQNNKLASHTMHQLTAMPRVMNFFYDSNSKLIGCTNIVNSTSEGYYRFVHTTNDIIYFEKISLPYNDPNTQVMSRYIAVFEGDDIVQAGRDYNLDGVMENANSFQYNNGNLISATNSTESLALNYTSTLNNMTALHDNSYGKKNKRIVCIESFCSTNFQAVLSCSKNLTTNEFLDATYEIHPSNYYHLKTDSYSFFDNMFNLPVTITNTTEFFFN